MISEYCAALKGAAEQLHLYAKDNSSGWSGMDSGPAPQPLSFLQKDEFSGLAMVNNNY